VVVTAVLGAYGLALCLDHWLGTRLSPAHFFTSDDEKCDGAAAGVLVGAGALAVVGVCVQLRTLRRRDALDDSLHAPLAHTPAESESAWARERARESTLASRMREKYCSPGRGGSAPPSTAFSVNSPQ
jgi:hypothetical protein